MGKVFFFTVILEFALSQAHASEAFQEKFGNVDAKISGQVTCMGTFADSTRRALAFPRKINAEASFEALVT